MTTTIHMNIGGGVNIDFRFTRFVETDEEVREAAENDKHLIDAYATGYSAAA